MAANSSPDRVDRILAQWGRERPDLDTTPQAVIGRLHRVALALTARLVEVYAAHGLSEPEFDLLATLRRTGEPFALPAGELAEHTMVTSGGLTKRVDRLVARGLVERLGAEGDARRRLVALTPAGRALIDAAFTDHVANEQRLLAELGQDAAAVAPILKRWLALLE
nr:MarR family transcriptional regulator [Microbacterium bovistercoris]